MQSRKLQRGSNRTSAAGAPDGPRLSIARQARAAGLALVLAAFGSTVSRDAAALRINTASDPALAGAVTQTFDAIPVGYFTSQSFLIGGSGFTIVSGLGVGHADDVF